MGLENFQKIKGNSLIHRCHGKGMQIVENQLQKNNSQFYICRDCNSREIPYLAKLLGYDEKHFYRD